MCRVLLPLMLLTCVLGCSKGPEFQRVEVSGTINLDGQPLDEGTVTFSPAEKVKGSIVQAKITGGKFSLAEKDGPAVGNNMVSVISVKKTGKKVQVEGEEQDEVKQVIPWQFNEETKLTADVKAKPAVNDFKFELTSKPAPRGEEGEGVP